MKAEYADLDVVLGVSIAFEVPKAAVDTGKARFEPDASRDASGQDPNRGVVVALLGKPHMHGS
jgi:hypothetical protein